MGVTSQDFVAQGYVVLHLKPIYEAAKLGQLSKARLIIDHVENENPKDIVEITQLHLAAEEGHLSICKLFLKTIRNKKSVTLQMQEIE